MYLQADIHNLLEIADILNGRIVIAIPDRLEPELKLRGKLIRQLQYVDVFNLILPLQKIYGMAQRRFVSLQRASGKVFAYELLKLAVVVLEDFDQHPRLLLLLALNQFLERKDRHHFLVGDKLAMRFIHFALKRIEVSIQAARILFADGPPSLHAPAGGIPLALG